MKDIQYLKTLYEICAECLNNLLVNEDRAERFKALETYEMAKKAIVKLEHQNILIFQPALA